ncbi:hypothetical protein ACFWXH_16700 [Mesorhizobium sp. NPDC059054]|uniref:hypothetical protein n=1 Tax=Mesorhizobium sp. NPDC059054 TaxID=3346711 RepID=UPI003698EAAA
MAAADFAVPAFGLVVFAAGAAAVFAAAVAVGFAVLDLSVALGVTAFFEEAAGFTVAVGVALAAAAGLTPLPLVGVFAPALTGFVAAGFAVAAFTVFAVAGVFVSAGAFALPAAFTEPVVFVAFATCSSLDDYGPARPLLGGG